VPEVPARRRAPNGWTLALAALVVVSFALRVWGVKQGLPYVYNLDENANFVNSAVGFFSGDYNPHYFVNPPAFSYLLHAVFALWYGEGWPFGSGGSVAEAHATNPTEVFVIARVSAAALGTAALPFVYWTGKRLYDRRVGLLAAAVSAVAFLPVFYSHLALNDVPALLPLAVSAWGSAGVLLYGRRRDYVVAGAALGFAFATKYTAGIAILPLLAAAGVRLARTGPARRPALVGLVLAGVAAAAAFVVANPYGVLSFSELWADVKKQESAASDLGKLGLTNDSGISYYVWVLTWGIGWAPLFAAVAGAALSLRDDWRKALFLVPWPIVFVLYMGSQDRYFGRWLIPALPAIALLAAVAVVKLADRLRMGPSRRALALCVAGAVLAAQGIVYSVHVDRVLSRNDTRNRARAWMVSHIPAGAKIVVEPIVPEAWFSDPGRPPPEPVPGMTPAGRRWRKFITTRTTVPGLGEKRASGVGRTITIEDYERTTRPALIDSYENGGFCWVVIGSTQYGRALVDREQVPDALPYYRELMRRGELRYAAEPYGRNEKPVRFNFDWSFDYYPMSYARPGPSIAVYRLHGGDCAPRR
jgi:hypothetical protein